MNDRATNSEILLAIGRLEGAVQGMEKTSASETRALREMVQSLSKDVYADLKLFRERLDDQGKLIDHNFNEFEQFRTKITTSFTILMAAASIIGGIVSTIGYLLIDKFLLS